MTTASAEIKPQYLRKSNDPVEDPFASFNLPKPNRLERLGTWIFNLARRRRVKAWQAALEEMRVYVLSALDAEVLSVLAGLNDCDDCKQQYAALRPLNLLSQVEQAVAHPVCTVKLHSDVLRMFAAKHRLTFDKARAISAWVCGFEAKP